MEMTEADLDKLFSALADPTRRATLARLAEGPATVGELAEPFNMSKPAVSKHLKVLRDVGLVERQVEGRHHRCTLRPEPLQYPSEWLHTYSRFWSTALDGLGEFLADEEAK